MSARTGRILVERLDIEVPRSWDQVLHLAEERRRAGGAGRDPARPDRRWRERSICAAAGESHSPSLTKW